MFTNHFKMSAHPFREKTASEFILRDERMAQGLARLDFLLHHGSLALITGDEGVGKSTLVRLFMDSLAKNRYRTIYVHLTHLNAVAFLRLLLSSMGEVPRRGKERVLMQIMNRSQSGDLTTLFLIDEAHLLDPDALLDLRLLLSSPGPEANGCKMVLIGHPDIKKELCRSRHIALNQRIAVRYHLQAFSPPQTRSYLDFQLRQAGSSEKLFDEDVKSDIHEYARGVPRMVNHLATACLINAVVTNSQRVTKPLFVQAIQDLHLF